MSNPLIVALDLPDPESAKKLVQSLNGLVKVFKVGSELFTAAGPALVGEIRNSGADVFLDLKFHDIPNTVRKAVASATRLGVRMLTVHTSGGEAMLRAAEEAAQTTARELGIEPPLALGVTVLTSFDSNGLAQIGVEANVAHQVERLANLAVTSGLRGLVCSPLEVARLRALLPGGFKLVTPGIRSSSSPSDDQKRTLSAKEAMDAGADWLVVGRPIYDAADPAAAARSLLDSLAGSGGPTDKG